MCAHRGAKLSKGEIKNTNLTFKFPKQ
ncbi:MAG: hypothetical protein ACTHWZ_05120 [Peptoniphilaceae bacterium]